MSLICRLVIVLAFFCTPIQNSFSQHKIDSLRRELSNVSGMARANILSELCSEYAYVQADSARLFGEEALALAGNSPSALRAQILYNIAITHQVQSNYSEALQYDEEALAIYQSLQDSLRVADLLNNIGLIHDEQGNYDLAAEYYQKALSIYQKKGDNKKTALVNVNLGVVFKALGDYKSSISNYQEALNEFEKIKDDYLMAVCHVNLGSVYLYSIDFDSALYHSLKAETMFNQLNYKRFETVAIGNVGIAYGKLKNFEKAIAYLTRAIDRHQEGAALKELAFCQLKLAEVYSDMKRNAEAIFLAKKALPLSEKAGALQQVTDINLFLSKCYEAEGNYKEAYQYQMNYLAGHDSLFQNDKLKQIRALQVQFETERRERELAESKVLMAQNELSIKQRDNQLVLALFGIIVLLLITFIVYRSSKVKQQKLSFKAALAEARAITALQDERLRISRELHDNIGSQLTFINSSVAGLAKKLPGSETAEVQKITLDTIRELRKTVWLINKTGIPLDEFVVKLREYLQQDSQGLISLSAEIEKPFVLSSKQATHIFRIVQEATNNALKYAKATQISVSLVSEEGVLIINIIDDGQGFNVNETPNGFGLQTMQERAKDLDASLAITSELSLGTKVQVKVPMEYDKMRMDKSAKS